VLSGSKKPVPSIPSEVKLRSKEPQRHFFRPKKVVVRGEAKKKVLGSKAVFLQWSELRIQPRTSAARGKAKSKSATPQ